MVRAIYLLFEILAIIVCLYWLFGKKIKITCGMICLIIIHMGLFTVCWSFFVAHVCVDCCICRKRV